LEGSRGGPGRVLRAQKKGKKKSRKKENKKEKKRKNEIRKIVTLVFMQVMKRFVNANDKDEDFSLRLFLISSRMDNSWTIQLTWMIQLTIRSLHKALSIR
jgi:hypothetical protein